MPGRDRAHRRCVRTTALAALAGALLVSAPPALAVQVSCGETISSDTKVSNDLSNCANGLVIDTDDVTLDLNGHTIDGDGGGGGAGIEIGANLENVIVKDGKVRQFGDGVVIDDGGNGHRLVGLKVTDNVSNGVEFQGTNSHSLVRSVQALDNDENGFDVNEGSGLLFQRTTAKGNDGRGFNLEIFANGVIESSSAQNNGGDGLFMDSNSSGNLIRGSGFVAKGNGDDGVEIDGSQNTLVAVRAQDSVESGIEIDGDDNKVLSSHAKGNAFEGIRIDSGATGTLLSGNTANENDQDGIEVNDAATTLRRNTANDNGFLGIDAVAGVTDLGGNKASGNDGAPPQCNNISCS